jgi:Flp pilus assembly protein TadB
MSLGRKRNVRYLMFLIFHITFFVFYIMLLIFPINFLIFHIMFLIFHIMFLLHTHLCLFSARCQKVEGSLEEAFREKV